MTDLSTLIERGVRQTSEIPVYHHPGGTREVAHPWLKRAVRKHLEGDRS